MSADPTIRHDVVVALLTLLGASVVVVLIEVIRGFRSGRRNA